MTDAAAVPGTSGEIRPEKRSKRSEEYRSVAVVSLAHFVNHFHNLVVPPLFPFLKAQLGIGFVELGLALTVANVLSVVAQLPVGFLGIWFRVARTLGKKPVRGAMNSDCESRAQAASRRWFAHPLL